MTPGAAAVRPTPGPRARPGGRPRRRTRVLAGLILAAVLSTRWVRLNISPSVPVGLYRLTAVQAPLARGTLVVLPVPARVQAWHTAWLPLLKPVGAVEDDLVCSVATGLGFDELWMAGEDYGPALHEFHGQTLPHLQGCVLIQPGEVFLASHAPHSFDSRYFSTVKVTALTAQAIPVLTWR